MELGQQIIKSFFLTELLFWDATPLDFRCHWLSLVWRSYLTTSRRSRPNDASRVTSSTFVFPRVVLHRCREGADYLFVPPSNDQKQKCFLIDEWTKLRYLLCLNKVLFWMKLKLLGQQVAGPKQQRLLLLTTNSVLCVLHLPRMKFIHKF